MTDKNVSFESDLKKLCDDFKIQIEEVKSIMTLDDFLIKIFIENLKSLKSKLESNQETKITNLNLLPDASIQNFENIRDNGTINKMYDVVRKQLLVLIVSYFTQLLEDIFKLLIERYYSNKKDMIPKNVDIKLSLTELLNIQEDFGTKIGNLIINKKKISFQDMQSTSRAYSDYLKINIPIGENQENIIISQAARHCIIHSLGKRDEKYNIQIRDLKSNSLNFNFDDEKMIVVTKENIEQLNFSMNSFVEELSTSM